MQQQQWVQFVQAATAIKRADSQLRGRQKTLREDNPEEAAVDVWMASNQSKSLLHTSIDELLRMLQPHLAARTAFARASVEWDAYCTSIRNHPVVYHKFFEAQEPNRLMPPGPYTQAVFSNANLRNLTDNQFYLLAEAEVPYPRFLVRMRDTLYRRLANKRPRDDHQAKHAALEANEDVQMILLRLTHTHLYSERLASEYDTYRLEQDRLRVQQDSHRRELEKELGRAEQLADLISLREDIKTSATTTPLSAQVMQKTIRDRLWISILLAMQKTLLPDMDWLGSRRRGLGPQMKVSKEPFDMLQDIAPKEKARARARERDMAGDEEEEKQAAADENLNYNIRDAASWVAHERTQHEALGGAAPSEDALRIMLRGDYVVNGWSMFMACASKNQQRCRVALFLGKDDEALVPQLNLLSDEYTHDLEQAKFSTKELIDRAYNEQEIRYCDYLAKVDFFHVFGRLLNSLRNIVADRNISNNMRVVREHLEAEIERVKQNQHLFPSGSQLAVYFNRRAEVLKAMDLAQTPVVQVDQISLTFDARLAEYEACFATSAFVSACTETTTRRDAIAESPPMGAPDMSRLYVDWIVDTATWTAYRPDFKSDYDNCVQRLHVVDDRLLPGIVLKPATDLLAMRESKSVTFRQVLMGRIALERSRCLNP